MREKKPMRIPAEISPAEWEEAFRKTEKAFARNKSRMWVLKCMRDELCAIVEGDAYD